MKHLANLLRKLRDTPEAAGTLFDHTAVAFLMEAGTGAKAPHTSERMAAIVAGGSSLNLNLRQRIVATGGAQPARVPLTALNAVGVSRSALGEVSGMIPGLWD